MWEHCLAQFLKVDAIPVGAGLSREHRRSRCHAPRCLFRGASQPFGFKFGNILRLLTLSPAPTGMAPPLSTAPHLWGDMEDDHKLLGAADYLSALAKALMNDIEMAKNRLH